MNRRTRLRSAIAPIAVPSAHAASMNVAARSGTPFNNLPFPTDVVLMVVTWRLRYKLSLRDLAAMFWIRGFRVYPRSSTRLGRTLPAAAYGATARPA